MNTYGNRDPHLRLYKSYDDRVIAGVCAGVAEYLGISTRLLRIITVIGLLFAFPTVIVAYALLAYFLKPRPAALFSTGGDADFYRDVRFSPSNAFRDLELRFGRLDGRLRTMEDSVTSREFAFDQELKRS